MKNRQASSRERPQFEELEPRILYSADAGALLHPDAITPSAEVRMLDLSTPPINTSDTTQAATTISEIVFVDTSVSNYQQLIDDIKAKGNPIRPIGIVLLDANQDSISQITETLSNYKNLDAVHLISHGSDGSIDIGNNQLNLQSLIQNKDSISAWGNAFTENGDFLIYGCNVAETQFGQGFIDYLSYLTKTDVSASTDATGNVTLGGNWALEYQTGIIDTQVVLSLSEQDHWGDLLSITSNGTITSANTTGATSLSWSHTVAAGTNRAMFVEVAIDGLGANVTGVTYGGVALTQVGRSTGNHAVEIWELTNPTIGTANVVVSFAGTTAAAAGATTYNGVSQSTPYSGFAGASGTGTTSSVTVTSATGDLVIDTQYWQGIPTGGAVGAGQTLQWQLQNAVLTGGSTFEAGAASVVMSGDFTSSAQWVVGAVSIKAAAGITVTPTSGLTTTEAGGTATFSVVLDKAPTANVTIGLSTSDSTEGTLSTSNLTFTTANWSTPQTVTITGVDDAFIDGNISYSIVTAAASSTDTSYNGLNASDITVTNTDDDTYNTLIVDTTNDTLDGTITSISALMANKGADGKISLREAIIATNNTANGTGGADRINFNITTALVGGVHTITLSYDGPDAGVTPDALPTITGAVIIDGTTEPDFAGTPVVVINGANAAATSNGLYITSGNSTVRGLTIQNFGGNGIYLQTGGGNLIEGNYIGTNSAGTAAAANNFGIVVLDSANNTLGGTTAASRNVLSGNTFDGINISGAGSTGNVVLGNYIGTNAAGTAAVSNAGLGIALASANNTVGGTTAGSGNLISGNSLAGVSITGTSATGNTVAGNYIGLNAAGTSAIANGETGVEIVSGAFSNTIGGATAAARNVISGNTQYGVSVSAQAGATANNTIQGNYLGTNAAGTAAVSNGGFGVAIDFAAANTNIIGNLISGNTNTSWSAARGGIYLYGSGGVIQGNTIGLDANGNTLGNGGGTGSSAGIYEAGGSSNVLIGGTTVGQGNIIANNTGAGILVNTNPGNITVLGNAIYSNTGIGIDLIGTNGVTANDAGDGDTGANNLQNFPVLSTAITNGSQVTISGSLNSAASSYYRVEFFANTTQDATGYGEGQSYLGYANVSTNASGNATINMTITATVAAGEYMSATATMCDSTYTTFTTTSEFSLNVIATVPNSAPVNTVPAAQTVSEDTALTISGITVNDVNGNLSTTQLTLSNGTLTVSLAGGASINAGANGSSTLILVGTQTQINAALATLSYQGNANYNGSDTLTVLSTDSGGLIDTDTLAITVTAVNDAPSGSDKTIPINEDTAYTFTAADFGFSDVDTGDSLSAVRIDTIPLAGSLTLSGVAVTAAQVVTAVNISNLVFTPAANANGAGYASFTFSVRDQSSAYDTVPNTITFNVTSVNDAPSFSSSMAFTGISEDATSNTGMLVSYFDSTISDADTGALKGIAITAVDNTHGAWQFTLDGTNWFTIGSVSLTSARLLPSDATASFRFVPNADWNGATGLVMYKAWDQTTGSAGGLADVSAGGGSTAFSLYENGSSLSVSAVNDAPTALTTAANLAAVAEDIANPSGATVTSLFGSTFKDAIDQVTNGSTANNFAGVAIVTNTANASTEGAWQWYNGSSWVSISSSVSTSSALTLAPTTLVRFMPNANYNGTPGTLTARLIDDSSGAIISGSTVNLGTGGGTTRYSDTNNAIILSNSVNPVNDAPTTTPVTLTAITEDSGARLITQVQLLANATDIDSSSLTATGLSITTGAGGLVDNGDSTWTYTPALNDSTSVTFSYTVTDGSLTTSGSASLDITPVNDAPVIAVPLSQGTLPDQTLTFSTSKNNAITISDLDANTNLVRVTISVLNGSLSLSQNTGLSFTIGDGVSDPTLTFDGTLLDINNALNGLVYTPTTGFLGTETINITADDLGNSGAGGALTDSKNISIDVNQNHFLQGNYLEIGINSTGSLGALSGTPAGYVNAGSSLGAIADSARDGWLNGYNGDFIMPGTPVDEWGVNIGGTTYYNATNGLVQNIAGTAGLTTDNSTTQNLVWNGATSGLNITNSYSVSRTDLFMDLNITLTNTTGSAMTDIYYYRNVDPDNNASTSGDYTTTNTIVSQGDNGSGIAFVSATQADGSYMGLQGFGINSRVSYGGFSNINPIDAYAGANGLSSSGSLLADAGIQIVYKLSLAAGESVTLNMRYVFDSQQAPKLDLDSNDSNTAGSGYQTTYIENAAPVKIADSDTSLKDIDSANLQSMTATISNIKNGVNEILSADTTGTSIFAAYNNGVLTLTGSDTVANYEQVLRTISYTNTSENPDATQRIITIMVNDGLNNSNIATATINVTPVNDAAIITPATANLTETNAPLSTGGTLAITDVDSAATFTVQAGITGSNGYGVFNLAGDGTWTYTANSAHDEFVNGTTYSDSLTVTSADGTTSIITVNILGTNDAPTASNVSLNVLEDNVLNGLLPIATDAEGATVTYSLGSTATHGSVTVGANGAFSYNPNIHYNGADSFTYTIGDGNGGTNTYTVSINVISVNNNPTASNATINAVEDTIYSGTLPIATDVEGDPIIYSLNTGALHGTVNVNAAGDFTYAPSANYNGADSFTYTVTDSLGGANTYTISIAIAAVNDAPLASDDSVTGLEDNNITGNVLTNDSDVENSALIAVLVNGPANGTLILNANGSFTYTPNANWNGTDTFTYKANDGSADSNIASVTITVTPQNDAPTTSAVALAAIAEDSGAHLITQAQLLANAIDVDGNSLTATNLAISAGNGVLVDNLNGTWTYTPASNDDTAVSFSYSVTDGSLIASGLANLDLTPVNDAPTDSNINISTLENTTYTGTLPIATDIEGDAIIYSLSAGASHGTVSINTDGSFTYTPVAFYSGADSFNYTIDDGNGGNNTYTVTINSINVNDPPTASNATINAIEDTIYTGTLPTATDPDLNTITYTLNAGALHGTVNVSANGDFTYASTANYNGADIFTYTVSDGLGGANTYTISINVAAVNDLPVANNDNVTGLEDNNVTGNVLTNDSDLESPTLTAVVVSGPANGILMLNSNGSFTYTPNANWNGTETFTYKANDGTDNSNIATVTIVITPINDAPTTSAITLPTILKDSGAHLITQAQLLANALDVDGDALTAINLTISVGNGVLVDNTNGTWIYTPGANDESLVTFSYTVTDGTLIVAGTAKMDIVPVIAPIPTPTPTPTPITPIIVDPITITPTPKPITTDPSTPAVVNPVNKPSSSNQAAAQVATTIDNNQNVIVNLDSNSIKNANSLASRLNQQDAALSLIDLINLPSTSVSNNVTEIFKSLTHNAQIQIDAIEFAEPKSSPAQLIGKIFFDNKIALTSVAVSAGLVAWAAQYGILFSSVLATLPAWRNLDPVAILGKDDDNEDTEWDISDDENDQAAEENAIEILSEKSS